MKNLKVAVKQRQSTHFLRAAIMAAGAGVALICIILLIQLAQSTDTPTKFVVMAWSMIAAAIPFWLALFQGLKLLALIDMNRAFSELSVKALQKIKYFALIISVIYTGCLPVIYSITQDEDAPGLMVIGMFFVGGPLVIAVFAGVLQKLLQQVIELKSENDLTV